MVSEGVDQLFVYIGDNRNLKQKYFKILANCPVVSILLYEKRICEYQFFLSKMKLVEFTFLCVCAHMHACSHACVYVLHL